MNCSKNAVKNIEYIGVYILYYDLCELLNLANRQKKLA